MQRRRIQEAPASSLYLGIMSGTSLDAVDMALAATDGLELKSLGPACECKLPDDLRTMCLEATEAALRWRGDTSPPAIFGPASAAIAVFQADAAARFLREHDLTPADVRAVGFHGQTVAHVRAQENTRGRTIQLGDPQIVADRLRVPVVYDLRRADIEAGGQGAPLAPIYHAARVRHSRLEAPIAVLNLGGVANLSFISADGRLTAFDVGPANGPLDQWVERCGSGRFDAEGAIAARGRADAQRIAEWLSQPYFKQSGPKSLDRYEFGPDLVSDMSLEDGAATLAAFCAACVALAIEQAPELPNSVIVCGGGRHNQTIMRELAFRVPADLLAAEQVGWRGDSTEAEAWAFLAARCVAGLPISFPDTTGVPRPLSGGRVALPTFLGSIRDHAA